MSDALLSVEVIAELSSLNTGLDQSTARISKFVSDSVPKLDVLQKALNALGVNTAAQGLDNVKEATQSARVETEKARKGLIDARTEQVKYRTELLQGKQTQEAAAGSYEEAKIQLAALGKEIRTSAGLMDGSNTSVLDQVTKYNLLNDKLKAVDKTMGNFGRSVGNYSMASGQALTDLGRVAQDLPYGFIGIQNNLNPMLESFGRLKTETGSTSGALKSMASGLMGPAGLGLALSAVSAGILLYQQYQQKAAKETEKTEAAINRAKKASESYSLTLDDVTRARLEGAKSAQSEITELKTLYNVTQDATLSMKVRNRAVDELQKKYPDYFKNLDDEAIKTGQAKTQYDELTESLLATARARAAMRLIDKNTDRQLENDQKLTDLEKDRVKTQKELTRLREIDAAANEGGRSGAGNITTATKVYNKAKELEAIQKSINNLKTDSNILTSNNLRLETEVTNQIKSGASIIDKVGNLGGEEKAKDIKTISDVLTDLNTDLVQIDNTFQLTFGEGSKKKIDSYQKAIDELIKLGYDPATKAVQNLKDAQQGLFQLEGVKGKDRQIPVEKFKPITQLQGGTGLGVVLDKELAESMQKLQDFSNDVNNLLNSGLADTLSGFGSAIGEALVNGGNVLEAAGGSLLKGFGSFLSQYGNLLIAYGTAAIIKTKLDAAALVPGAGLIAGPAAIAAGIALQIAGAAIGSFVSGGGQSSSRNSRGGSSGPEYGVPHFANGGIVSGPTLAMVGEYPGAKSDPEVISPLSKLKSMIGDRSGNQPTFVISNEISMGKLVTAIRREERNNSRF